MCIKENDAPGAKRDELETDTCCVLFKLLLILLLLKRFYQSKMKREKSNLKDGESDRGDLKYAVLIPLCYAPTQHFN